MKPSAREVAAATPVVFSVGLPFGPWEVPARELFGTAPNEETAASRIHTTLLRLSAAQEIKPEEIDRLRNPGLTPAQWRAWPTPSAGTATAAGVDSRLCWTASALADACPETRFIVWVEHPGHAFAHWLASRPADEETSRILALLRSATDEMLLLVQRHHGRCLVVDVDDALANPAKLVERLSAWQMKPAASSLAARPAADALALTLGTRSVAVDETLMKAHQHLAASCALLAEESPADVPDPDFSAVVTEAVRLYRGRLLRRDREHEELLAGRDRAVAESETLRRQAAEMSADLDSTLLQLHKLQERVAGDYLSGADRRPRPGQVVASSGVSIGGIEFGAATEAPPLRGLTLNLNEIRIGSRSFDRLTVRLVEHHGHPGIAIFESGGADAKPLRDWKPAGEKGRRAFVLLVPEDAPSREALLAMDATDWDFVHALSHALSTRLSGHAPEALQQWIVIAQRLLNALDSLPTRLRFDSIEVGAEPSDSTALRIVFNGVALGFHHAASVGLLWQPEGADGGDIDLLMPEGAGAAPLLRGWPVGNDGKWTQRWRLPLHGNARELAGQWSRLALDERELVMELLSCLPAAVGRAAELKVIDEQRAGRLRAAASRAVESAQRLLRGMRQRQALRTLLRRPAS